MLDNLTLQKSNMPFAIRRISINAYRNKYHQSGSQNSGIGIRRRTPNAGRSHSSRYFNLAALAAIRPNSIPFHLSRARLPGRSGDRGRQEVPFKEHCVGQIPLITNNIAPATLPDRFSEVPHKAYAEADRNEARH